jgi:hypothetical protein
MGLSVRVFLLNEHGEPERFSAARFERLWSRDAGERLREAAGREARFVIAYIETVDGDFLRLARVDYMRVKMDANGRVDKEARRRQLQMVAGGLEPLWLGPRPRKTIPAEHIFRRRQYQSEFHWTPSAAQEQAIVRLIQDDPRWTGLLQM